jgi:GNAT superfamily N-acetyltransferase
MTLPAALHLQDAPWLAPPLRLARFDVEGTVPQALGEWMLAHTLFAEGRDFTGFDAHEHTREIRSRLKRHWSGEMPRETPWTGLTGWVLLDADKPMGVGLWERGPEQISWVPEVPKHPMRYPRREVALADVGGLALFLKPEYRQQGLMRGLMNEVMRPALRAHRGAVLRSAPGVEALPLLSAQGATARLVEAWKGDWVLNTDFRWCQHRRTRVWEAATGWRLEDPRASVRPLPPPKPTRRKVPVPG